MSTVFDRRQHHEAAVGTRLLGIFRLAPEVLPADDQPGQRLAVRAVELDLRAGLVQVEARAVRSPIGSLCPTFRRAPAARTRAPCRGPPQAVALGDYQPSSLRCSVSVAFGSAMRIEATSETSGLSAGAGRACRRSPANESAPAGNRQRAAADDRQQHPQDGRDAGVQPFFFSEPRSAGRQPPPAGASARCWPAWSRTPGLRRPGAGSCALPSARAASRPPSCGSARARPAARG